MDLNLSWVPRSCCLYLTFDGSKKQWSGSLRLRGDYLGYLVLSTTAETIEETIKAVEAEFLNGLRKLDEFVSKHDPRAGYYRQVI